MAERQFKFDNFVVGISANKKLASTVAGQVMVLTAVNLVARFTKRLVIGIDEASPSRIYVPGAHSGSFASRIFEFAKSIDNTIVLARRNSWKGTPDALIAIGPVHLDAPFSVSINSDGWLAELSDRADLDYTSNGLNPIGAQAAATLATAETFKEILRKLGSDIAAVRKRVSSIRFSTLDLAVHNDDPPNPELPSRIHLGDVYLIGAGAVGSSLVYSMRYIQGLSGRLTAIDFDVIDDTNLNRYLTARTADVGRPKVEVVSEFLRDSEVLVSASRNSYESFVKETGRRPLPLVVSTVDNNQAREHIQSDLPREVLHGATHEQTFVISRHDFINDACLGCLFFRKPKTYSEQIADETGIPLLEVERVLETDGPFTAEHLMSMVEKRSNVKDRYLNSIGRPFKTVYAQEICGTLTVQVGKRSEAATASFVSAMPGILLMGEILKERVPELREYRLSNYFQMSLFSPEANKPLFRMKDPRCVCLCSDKIMVEAYRKKWLS